MRMTRTLVLALVAPLSFLLTLVACSTGGPTSTDVAPVILSVDPSIEPPVESLPPLGGSPRPVAVLEDGEGTRAAFVADELWVASDDRPALDALLARWNGTILIEADPSDAGIAGLKRQYLVRIDPTLADASRLPSDLSTLDPTSTGRATVSSTQALGLLAAGAREAVEGLEVGVNWVGAGASLGTQAVANRTLTEAPSGPALGGTAYTPNPFTWPTHDVGSPQDIGVAEAWRALDAAGRLTAASVPIAIIDMGFAPDEDLPATAISISNVPGLLPTGTQNLLDCGSPCPWHGTNVMSAAFARPDNRYGSAGPAGPVAEPLLVFTLYDMFSGVTALFDARVFGARIANMSYGVPVPWYAAWSVLPFEAATAAARASGMLLFAAAGNAGDDIDAEAKDPVFGRGLGFEGTWYTPCENAGVICVGGLSSNSLSRAPSSNFGSEQVDLFAPYFLWVGPDPEAPDNVVRVLQGTSLSSPFAAGVAALVWAADPSQSADDVEDALFDNAKTSGDDDVGLVVDAHRAVGAVLGNVPPTVVVQNPDPGDEVDLNLPVNFNALVSDLEDGVACCEVTWTSDVDGALGSARAISTAFSTVGPRVITLTAVDSDGGRTRVDVPITVVNEAPRVEITNPAAGSDVFQNTATTLRGTSFDLNEPGAELACGALVWTSSDPADVAFPLFGCEVQASFGTLGSRTLTLTGTDPQGASDVDTTTFTVVEPPPNLPPSVRITSPENFQSVGINEQITLSGSVSDPEGASPLALVWTIAVNGAPEQQIGTGNNVPWTPSDSIDFSGEDRYDVTITLSAQDPEGNTGVDFVQLVFIIIN